MDGCRSDTKALTDHFGTPTKRQVTHAGLDLQFEPAEAEKLTSPKQDPSA